MASWGLSKYIETKLIFLPHFLHNFWRKIFLLLYSVNWPNFIVRYWADMWDIGQILGRYVRYWANIGQICEILGRYWADMWDIGQLLGRCVIYWADIGQICEILGSYWTDMWYIGRIYVRYFIVRYWAICVLQVSVSKVVTPWILKLTLSF